jgi:hypothetical protein
MKSHALQTESVAHSIPWACLALAVASLIAWPSAGFSQIAAPTAASTIDYAAFKEPPAEYRGHRWLDFNLSNLTDARVASMVQQASQGGAYGGFMITPGGGSTELLSDTYMKTAKRKASNQGVAYLSEEYFRLYKLAIDEGLKNNLPLDVLYDELQFPSGMAGGLFYSKYPDDANKSLEKIEKDAQGPAKVELAIPIANGIFVGAVKMNMDTLQCTDVSDRKTAPNAIECPVEAGDWKVMLFYLDPTFRRGYCDYLDAGAVDKLISVMYEPYYAHLKQYFGNPIKMTFYDEPSLHGTNGRMWTPGFNQAFEKKYGFSPMKYYPALWYDISPETAAARNALFGFRAELYAENFVGRIAAWCAAHGISMSGHMDQEEAPNPVGTQADLMKIFKHQQVPGIDDIWFTGRSNVAYKIVSSAACNYDRPVFMAETYAAYRQGYTTAKIAYRTAMDQHAMGANMQIGNRPGNVGPEMGQYVGRLEYLLRGGRHAADIAVLYPIAAMQAAYCFATPIVSQTARLGSSTDFYYALEGGIVPPELDYIDLGEMLFRGLRLDYTYLHPEILEGKCLVEGNRLIIDNKENREEFRVLIVPGGDTISVAVAKKILEFYRAGGTVVATHKLPSRSAEFQQDKEARRIVGEVFGIPFNEPMTAELRAMTDDFKTYFVHPNAAGGRAFFLPRPDPKMFTAVLNEALPVRDVDIQLPPMWPVKMGTSYDGALTYIHKVKDNRDIYFFANSADTAVDAKVVLRGKRNLALWNPQSGERLNAELGSSQTAGQSVTTVRLVLEPVTSVFFVQE